MSSLSDCTHSLMDLEPLDSPRACVIHNSWKALWDGFLAYLFALCILNAYVADAGFTRNEQCVTSALAMFGVLSFYPAGICFIPTKCIFPIMIEILNNVKIIACMFLGFLFAVYTLISRYGEDKIRLVAVQFGLKGTLTGPEIYLQLFEINFLFVGLVYSLCYSYQLGNYNSKKEKHPKSPMMFPFVVACCYYLILQYCTGNVGDPIQFGMHLALTAVLKIDTSPIIVCMTFSNLVVTGLFAAHEYWVLEGRKQWESIEFHDLSGWPNEICLDIALFMYDKVADGWNQMQAWVAKQKRAQEPKHAAKKDVEQRSTGLAQAWVEEEKQKPKETQKKAVSEQNEFDSLASTNLPGTHRICGVCNKKVENNTSFSEGICGLCPGERPGLAHN